MYLVLEHINIVTSSQIVYLFVLLGLISLFIQIQNQWQMLYCWNFLVCNNINVRLFVIFIIISLYTLMNDRQIKICLLFMVLILYALNILICANFIEVVQMYLSWSHIILKCRRKCIHITIFSLTCRQRSCWSRSTKGRGRPSSTSIRNWRSSTRWFHNSWGVAT